MSSRKSDHRHRLNNPRSTPSTKERTACQHHAWPGPTGLQPAIRPNLTLFSIRLPSIHWGHRSSKITTGQPRESDPGRHVHVVDVHYVRRLMKMTGSWRWRRRKKMPRLPTHMQSINICTSHLMPGLVRSVLAYIYTIQPPPSVQSFTTPEGMDVSPIFPINRLTGQLPYHVNTIISQYCTSPHDHHHDDRSTMEKVMREETWVIW